MRWNRQELISQLKTKEFELLVIGGGSVGAGIVLDASTRGYSAALIEAADFASGTSSKSTKLIHGGVRYLEKAFKQFDYSQYSLVKEALDERETLLSIAPHLTHSLPIIIPFYHWYEKFYYGLGVKVYEWMAGNKNIGRGTFLSAEEVIKLIPKIQLQGLKGGIVYYDGQFNDSRMNVSIILTALENGAVASNYVELLGFEKKEGKIIGVKACDCINEEVFTINAKLVVNATGPFADEIRLMDNPKVDSVLQGSSGIHILLDRRFTPEKTGLLIPKTEDGRVLFLLPWQGKTLLGTTDEPVEISRTPEPRDEEIEYLLKYINRYLDETLTCEDIRAVWTGIRPLIRQSDVKGTGKLSRDYAIEVSSTGLYSIYGGKWTLYRKMAEDLLDAAIENKDLEYKRDCQTSLTSLVGSSGELLEIQNVEADIAEHLIEAYGENASKVLEIAESGYFERLVDGYPYIEAEVIYAVRYELAQTEDDILSRRIQLALLDQKAAEAVRTKVSGLLCVSSPYS